MSAFERLFKLRFRHCDPAGIAFYPRLVELVNDTVEDWFAELAYDFGHMHNGHSGVPTAALSVQFHSPGRMGDQLQSRLVVRRLSERSVVLDLCLACGERKVLSAEVTLVHVRNDPRQGKPSASAWPEAVRAKMQDYKTD